MRRLAALVLLILACRGHGGSPTAPDVRSFGPATLSGRVYFSETGDPVVRTRVLAQVEDTMLFKETATDAGGRYLFSDLSAGRYAIEADKPNTVQPGVRFSVRLGAGMNTLDLPISATSCVTLSGFVRDAKTNRGINGAFVTLEKTTRTNSDGSYALLLGCPPYNNGTTHSFFVEHPNYKTYQALTMMPSYSMNRDVVMQPR